MLLNISWIRLSTAERLAIKKFPLVPYTFTSFGLRCFLEIHRHEKMTYDFDTNITLDAI